MQEFWQSVGHFWWLKNAGKVAAVEQQQTRDTQIDRALAAHDEVNRRWFDYELDLATLIDFPMMTDMREPLTVDFHRAKRIADSLRPATRDELHDPAVFAEYRDAVRDFEVAFDIAEREAKRRRRTGFSPAEQEALERARKLVAVAADQAATPAERQAAYRKARAELDGLIVVPEAAAAAIERRIAGAIGPGPTIEPSAIDAFRTPLRDTVGGTD